MDAWRDWRDQWERTMLACMHKGGELVEPLQIGPPAHPKKVEKLEEELGTQIPAGFRRVLMGFSEHVALWWALPEGCRPPGELDMIFSGMLNWNLEMLPTWEDRRKMWVESCFPDPADPYNAIWHEKLCFFHVPNGDFLAIDLKSPGGAVVYLSHDGSDQHGWRLGRDFIDFVERWSLLGCVGAEDRQWRPFYSEENHELDPNCENAKEWRRWFSLGEYRA